MTKRILGVAAVFGLGVGIGCAAAPLVVPKASAQQAATLTKWEHSCEELHPNAIDSTAKKFGAEGFEMVALSTRAKDLTFWACFKRPKM